MRRILFLTVVYALEPNKTSTIKSLTRIDFSSHDIIPTLAIWDNSKIGYNPNLITNFDGKVKYYHTGKNQFLSVVYNRVIKDNDFDWVVILDDDSCVKSDYIGSFHNFFNSKQQLAAPQIINQGNIISPGALIGVKGKAFKNNEVFSGITKSKYLTAMMSGTIISAEAAQKVRFDERLSFYGVDTRFFIDYGKLYSHLYILDVIFIHNSALRDSRQSNISMLNRLRNLMESWIIVFDETPLFRLRLFVYMTLFITKQSIKYRDVRFIKLSSVLVKLLGKNK